MISWLVFFFWLSARVPWSKAQDMEIETGDRYAGVKYSLSLYVLASTKNITVQNFQVCQTGRVMSRRERK